jgi:hypothetical protein
MLPEEIEKINQLILVIQERDKQMDRMWSAIYQLQNDMNNLQTPKETRFVAPKTPPAERTRQLTLDDFNTPINRPWSEAQWEQWATDIYMNYPQVAQYLPDWFLAKMQKKQC